MRANHTDKTILVVEADVNLRRLLEVILRSIGDIVPTSSLAQATAALAVGGFDAAVTHLGIGYLGYGWVDTLVDSGLPTVVLTGMALPEQLAPINPAAHVVLKPFRPESLGTLVSQLVAG